MDSTLLQKLAHGSKAKAKPKSLKEFHAKEQHDGSYHVKRHSGKPNEQPIEHSAADMGAVHEALEQHMGEPNDGEAEAAELGAGQPGMGGQPPVAAAQ